MDMGDQDIELAKVVNHNDIEAMLNNYEEQLEAERLDGEDDDIGQLGRL
jgi:hypothetical protein